MLHKFQIQRSIISIITFDTHLLIAMGSFDLQGTRYKKVNICYITDVRKITTCHIYTDT